MNHPAPNVPELIDRLGGTFAVAKLCEVAPPSVSEWKANNRIPPARLMFLRLARPEVFELQEELDHQVA